MEELPDTYKPVSTGTTIMAIIYDGGVLLGADSRTSTGNYVFNRATDKIEYIHDRIYALGAGNAADIRFISKIVRYYLQTHSVELGKLPQLKTAARLYQQMQYDYKDNLLASVILCGWDPVEGAQIIELPPGGSMIKSKYACSGSGSGYITGFIDANYKENMSLEEAKKFVLTAVSLAMRRDGFSGGICRMVNVTKDQVTREFFDYQSLPYKKS